MKELAIRNGQRIHRLNTAYLRIIGTEALQNDLQLNQYSCAIHIVSPKKMAEVNWNFLQHEGSTDVITFDYNDYPEQEKMELAGEIFICYEDAIKQAAQFSTSAESELVRYMVHGFLHLLGFDDLVAEKRKVMKRQENRILKELEKKFRFGELTSF